MHIQTAIQIVLQRRLRLRAIACGLLIMGCGLRAAAQFTLVGNNSTAVICMAPGESACVKRAVQDLVGDVKKITAQTLPIVYSADSCRGNCVVIATATNPEAVTLLSRYDSTGAPLLQNKWEAYKLKTSQKQQGSSALLIAGSDERGTQFGIYDFIQHELGVDPLYYWKDKEPAKKEVLAWKAINRFENEPTFKFRGWFINDEDLLTEWMESGGPRKLDYPFYSQVVNPAAISRVMEALVRLRMNLVIPASFVDINNPAEARLVEEAAARGLFVSMHHVEPMGVSAFTFFNYWEKQGKKPLFSFYSSRNELMQVWREYAARWARYPNVIWQIGLRGIADRPMWMADPLTPQTDAERGALISEAMRLQLGIIKEVTKQSTPLVTTTLWGEGSEFFREGYLKIPSNVMCIFSDNSPGWRWQKDFYETVRTQQNKYGVYYHHQLWSSGPHLAQAVSPARTYQVLQDAVKKGSTAYAIMNVSNVREFVLGLEASARMLYRFPDFQPARFMQEWTATNFGKGAAKALQSYQTYFASFQSPDKQPVPFLLDGHLKGKGLAILNKLSLQLTDPVKFKEEEKEKRSQEKSWASGHLSDMNPDYNAPEELASKLAKQQQGFRDAYRYALQAEAGMDADEKGFFKTNLVAQLKIMLGLGDWLSHIMQASEAYQQSGSTAATKYLEQALTASREIEEGMAINSRGKWEHWYRGDKKMNVAFLKTQTSKLLQEMQQANNKNTRL